MRKRIRLTESKLNRIVRTAVNRILRESFEDDYNNARNNSTHRMWGFEMRNNEGDWQYGEIEYNPKTQKMSCMGVSIDVDPDATVDQNLEALYDELVNNGFYDE